MALNVAEKEEFIKLVHKMGEDDGDHTWGSDVLVKRVTDKPALVGTILTDQLSAADLITAIDLIPAPAKAAAVIRWA
jgi:hypothetical protein